MKAKTTIARSNRRCKSAWVCINLIAMLLTSKCGLEGGGFLRFARFACEVLLLRDLQRSRTLFGVHLDR